MESAVYIHHDSLRHNQAKKNCLRGEHGVRQLRHTARCGEYPYPYQHSRFCAGMGNK